MYLKVNLKILGAVGVGRVQRYHFIWHFQPIKNPVFMGPVPIEYAFLVISPQIKEERYGCTVDLQ